MILEKELMLGMVPICQRIVGTITIKNLQKQAAIFNVSHKLPPYTEVLPMKGKMLPDQTLILKVQFHSKVASQINSDIIIQLRGGKETKIAFSVTTIIPKIQIHESVFDFGEITTLEKCGIRTSTFKSLQ